MADRQVGSSQLGCGSIRVKKHVILSGLETGQVNRVASYGLSRVNSYFPHNFFFNKVNNMYLPFKKSISKLLDVKCITSKFTTHIKNDFN